MIRSRYLERFRRRFLNTCRPVGGCMEWVGLFTPAGYARTKYRHEDGRIEQRANRVSYILFTGPIPDGRVVMHSCDNPRCVKPEHLWLGSHKDNSLDMVRKGRQAYGERNGNAKLSREQVEYVKRHYDGRRGAASALGRMFGVTPQAITSIVRGVNRRLG